MITLHESLVEWTVLALGVAVCAALLLLVRRPAHVRSAVGTPPQPLVHKPLRLPGYWLPCLALVVIVANAGIAVNAAAAAARSEAAGAWGLWGAATVAPATASAAAGASAAGAANASGARELRDGAAAAAVGVGAIAALACLVVLLMVWLYLSRSVRVLASAPQDDDCCGACPHCTEAGLAAPMEATGRKRARGLTMTRLGGG